MLSLVFLAAFAADPDLLEPSRFAADGTPWKQTKPLSDAELAEAKRKHPTLATWLERTKKERSLEFRADAVGTLVAIAKHPHTAEPDRQDCLAAALSLLADKNVVIRRRALQVVEAYGGDQAKSRSKVVACLKDREQVVREAAVKLLARYGDDSVVKPVAALAMADPVLREDCIVALVSIGTPDAAKAIEAMLKRAREPRDRERLLVAIDQINRKRPPE